MRKRQPKSKDENQTAFAGLNEIINRDSKRDAATGHPWPVEDSKDKSEPREKDPAAIARGHLGGLKGGQARAEKLSPRKRRQIAKRAAQVRWTPADEK